MLSKDRKSYTREFKLQVIGYFYKIGENQYATAKHFKVDKNTVKRWVRAESLIKTSKQHSKRIGCGRKAFHPDLEKALHEKFLDTCRQGKASTVNARWFRTQAKILTNMLPGTFTNFKFSESWFNAFKRRYKISLSSLAKEAQIKPKGQEYERELTRQENTPSNDEPVE
ncbi:hypothetical protein BC937DRAFT_94481 [Endogone sp. FLAS-F59071]|nr:hypothetical protein BC937DRAFT_94481 [Endogone sp. FLAS-F59071]|eukprot:RUS20744.1 hypothetical protein BC937DRAFT_94481 [Endogone sp. FLAS-F59071]